MKQTIHAQIAIEYVLVFVAVMAVLFVALGPNGVVTKAINESLNTALVDGTQEMARGVFYNVYAEPGTTVATPY